jgi:hypothetical protein
MSTLILKLDATGDVVRTTPLLRVLTGPITWITASRNMSLVDEIAPNLTCVPWERRAEVAGRSFSLAVNLEDEIETARFLGEVRYERCFGAHLTADGQVTYTTDSSGWFDLSLISRFGRARADELKFLNRDSYQSLIFAGLGFDFRGQRYLLPKAASTGLQGDVALAPVAGPVWPMKGWAHYDALAARLREDGLVVNVLPQRPSLPEHIADIAGHRCLVSGDSLPMHLALGLGIRCVTIFNCTSPWEIHDYGLQTQMVSPLLGEHFYKRAFDERATTAIGLDEVHAAVLEALRSESRPELIAHGA